ncbi:TetR/AcrR family transcriptional regulator [Occultella gossypii]|uniref:Helix-turn-helix transcriptional regulator n=1 Tax=Occultella gossypii TaxID=2800820 RepID=A0ABS7SHA8_9MICO|nr:helix-turn-helix domain-containing protein [Occultella gossypii]MBZ2199535.1 helix-turn-helix transcriptional regulator [Occultella gossypii]
MTDWIPLPGSAKARLLDAAIDHLQRQGYEALSVQAVAHAAGVTTGSLYHHFGNKLGLFTMVRDEMDKRMVERIEGALDALAVAGGSAGKDPDGDGSADGDNAPDGGGSAGVNGGASAGARGAAVLVDRSALATALEVAFDAAVRFGVTRVLAEPRPDGGADVIAAALVRAVPGRAGATAAILTAAWRQALRSVADGADPDEVRVGLRWLVAA